MEKKLILGMVLFIFLIAIVGAVEFKTVYNPFTGKLDYYVGNNHTGENITADYFIGDGSLLTNVDVSVINLTVPTCSVGEVLTYNGTDILCVTDVSGAGNASFNQTLTDSLYTYTNGSGISLVNFQFNHSDTSSQASSDNSGNTFIQDIVLDVFGHITSITTAVVSMSNIFNQDLNTTSQVTFENLTLSGNITVQNGATINDLLLNGVNVSIFMYNQTIMRNIFNQELNTTSNVRFDNLTIINNLSIGNGLNTSHFTTQHQHTPQNNLMFNWYDDGSEIFLNTSGVEAFNIESANAKIILFDEPKSANDFKLFQVFNKQAQVETEFVITQAGNTLTSYFIRSLALVGNGTAIPTPFNCSTYANFIDCNTDITGPDLFVLDDIETNGSVWFGAGSFHVDDFGNLNVKNITISEGGNLTTTNITILSLLSCSGKLITDSTGNVFCGSDDTGASVNLFDQQLNTTSNVTFGNVSTIGLIVTKGATINDLLLNEVNVSIFMYNQTIMTNIFDQTLNTTSAISLGDLILNGVNVSQFLYNQTFVSNIFNQDLNTTDSPQFVDITLTTDTVDKWLHNQTAASIARLNSTFWTIADSNLYATNINLNVGIGTILPTDTLNIKGTLNVTDDVVFERNLNMTTPNSNITLGGGRIYWDSTNNRLVIEVS